MGKALFTTKFEKEFKHNGEIVDVMYFKKGKDSSSDRYCIKFNDNSIGVVYTNELDFDIEENYN